MAVFLLITAILSTGKQTVHAIQNGELSPNSPLVVPIDMPSRPGFSFTCSGTLITSTKVVTAAHCVFNKAGQIPDSIRVGSPGSSNAYTAANMSKWKKVIKVETAPGLNLDNISTDEGDIAILTLEAPWAKSPSVKLATEAQVKNLISNQTDLILFGYGVTEPGIWPDFPSKLTGKISKAIGKKEFGFLTPTGTMCDGDSGGPIFYKDGDSYLFVGAVSRSGGTGACGNSEFIATYLYPYLIDFKLSIDEINKDQKTDTSPSTQVPSTNKVKTIQCIKGKITKKVSGLKPKCPSGYKLKS
jgi:secreted trypsin-like serine protease